MAPGSPRPSIQLDLPLYHEAQVTPSLNSLDCMGARQVIVDGARTTVPCEIVVYDNEASAHDMWVECAQALQDRVVPIAVQSKNRNWLLWSERGQRIREPTLNPRSFHHARHRIRICSPTREPWGRTTRGFLQRRTA